MIRKEYFNVRLNRIKIIDNKEWGAAEVQILSFITMGNDNLPSLEGYLDTNSSNEKKDKIKQAAVNLASFKEFIEVHNVDDNGFLTFGKAGITVLSTNKIPIDLNWSLVLIEKDKSTRVIGNRINNIIKSTEFNSFADNIVSDMNAAVSPQIAIGLKIGKYIAAQTGRMIANNKDDQIGLFITSLNRFQHFKYGESKCNDVRGVNGNIFIDYTIFCEQY